MKLTNRSVYLASTALVAVVISFSMVMMFVADWRHLGFPTYLRSELLVAKLLGLGALLVPGVPARVREWAYAGFAIVLVSASVAHASSGDGAVRAMERRDRPGLDPGRSRAARPARRVRALFVFAGQSRASV